MMVDNRIGEQMQTVRMLAAQLVAQLGADSSAAAPFLQAITALEQQVLNRDATAPDRDVTSSAEHLQDALHHAEARAALFQQVLTDVPTGVCLLQGQEQRYIFTNPSYDQLAGRTNVIGKTVPEVFPEIAD